MAKTPSRILRLFQPEKGWLRHAWPHVQLPASICTRNPSRWDTSRSRSRSSRGTRSLFVINPLQLTRFAPMEFTVPGDRLEREGRLSWWRSGTRNLSPSPSIFLFVPQRDALASQSPTGPREMEQKFPWNWSNEVVTTFWARVVCTPSCRG